MIGLQDVFLWFFPNSHFIQEVPDLTDLTLFVVSPASTIEFCDSTDYRLLHKT
jgi:hypothetical protein